MSNPRPAIPFSAAAFELASYTVWSSAALQGQGVRLQGIGYGEASRQPLFGRAMPWQQPPPQSVPIFEEAAAALPAVGIVLTVLSFTVPLGFDALFDVIAAADVQTGTAYQPGGGEITWRLVIDSKPVDGFFDFANPQGSAERMRTLPKMGLEALSGQTVRFQTNHVSNVGLNGDLIRCALGGYYYPSQPR